MKKISVLFISLIALVAVFTSCNPIVDAPGVVVTQDVDTVYFEAAKTGTVVTFTIVITPDAVNGAELSELKITKGDSITTIDLGGATSSVTKTYTYTVTETTAQTLTFKFEASNLSGEAQEETATIKVMEAIPTDPEIITATGKTVNYNSTSATTEFGWVLDPTAKGVTISQVNSADADLVFFFNDTYRQQLLSPNAAQIEAQDAFSTWSYDVAGKNTTKIQKVTASDWTNATEASINDLTVTSGTHAGGGNGYANVAVDDVYAFELSDGRKGLCKVSASNPPYKSPLIASTITLDFKYQETANSGK
jgi:hypothetical protein